MDFIPWNSESFNYHQLIVNNINTMIWLAMISDDDAKENTIREYKHAIANLPKKILRDTELNDVTTCERVMTEMKYIVQHKDDLTPVFDYLMQNAFVYASPE
jgi:hypothetical protein